MDDLNATERMIAALRAKWGQVHLDLYGNGDVLVSDRDAYERTHSECRLYQGADMASTLKLAMIGERVG